MKYTQIIKALSTFYIKGAKYEAKAVGELVIDYDYVINYHLGKAKVVINALKSLKVIIKHT